MSRVAPLAAFLLFWMSADVAGQPVSSDPPTVPSSTTTSATASAGSRLLFGPTGRMLRAGHGYVGVYEVVMPFVEVGVTDWLTVGGGTPLALFPNGRRPFWFTPKVRVYARPSVSVAAGVMQALNVSNASPGVAYGVATVGSADTSLTVGTGVAYARFSDQRSPPILILGGERRLSRRTKLISENYFFSGGGLVSAGVRFFGQRLSADVGWASPLALGAGFPVVNVVWRFGPLSAQP